MGLWTSRSYLMNWFVSVVLFLSLFPYGTGNNSDSIQLALDHLYPENVTLRIRGGLFDDGSSGMRRRCDSYLACEYHVPVAELRKVAFENGKLILFETKNEISSSWLTMLHGAKPDHLPSCLVQVRYGQHDFVAGPMIQYGSSQQCSTFRNDNALFLFPWEPHNAYHTLNDNIMALLASSLLQFALSPPTLRKELSPRVLYRFKAFAPRPVSTLFQTIGLLYPNSASAYKLLTGGPHCITRATWGTQMKPFYRDSLHLLRYRLYDLLKHTLSHALQLPIIPAARNLTVSSSFDLSRVPKVIIVTRNMNESSNAGTQTRKLSVASERLLVQEFEKLGTHVSICCDFGRMDAKALVETFWDVDICVGIHGAGLGNCVLGARGLVLAELQVAYNFGFDSFMKIAHMTRGSYVFHDIRNAPNNRGVVLSPEVVRDLAHVALAAWRRSQGDLPVVDQRSARDSMLETVLKAATAPMPQPSSPEAVTERLYNHEVVVDGTNRRLFARDLQFAQSLRIDKERWDVRERRGASRPASTPPSSRREFWIFPNPFVHSDRVESILGPRFTENYGHCVTLPYLKFRVMTQAPGARSLECDRHIIHTKRSGMNDNAITTSLLPR